MKTEIRSISLLSFSRPYFYVILPLLAAQHDGGILLDGGKGWQIAGHCSD